MIQWRGERMRENASSERRERTKEKETVDIVEREREIKQSESIVE